MRLVKLIWLLGTKYHPERCYAVATFNSNFCAKEQEVRERLEARAVD